MESSWSFHESPRLCVQQFDDQLSVTRNCPSMGWSIAWSFSLFIHFPNQPFTFFPRDSNRNVCDILSNIYLGCVLVACYYIHILSLPHSVVHQPSLFIKYLFITSLPIPSIDGHSFIDPFTTRSLPIFCPSISVLSILIARPFHPFFRFLFQLEKSPFNNRDSNGRVSLPISRLSTLPLESWMVSTISVRSLLLFSDLPRVA